MRRLITSILTFVLFAFGQRANAQATASLSGAVLFESGQPSAGALVELRNPRTGLHLTVVADGRGRFSFVSLPTSGQLEVAASAPGYLRSIQRDIVLRSGESIEVHLTLTVVKAGAVEVVADRGARINRRNAEVAGHLSEVEVRNIPAEARDLSQQLWFLPGITPATGYFTEAPNVSIDGANSLFTNYEIDGLDNNEQFLGGQKFPVPTGIVQNVSVRKNTYSAEFGRTANGIIDVTTRSGTNERHAELFYELRPGPTTPFQARSPFNGRDLTGNAVKAGFERNQFGGSLSGALRPDRTFYFVDAEVNLESKRQLIASPIYKGTVDGRNHYGLFTGKLDQLWSNAQRSSARLSIGDVEIARPGGEIGGSVEMPSAGSFQDRKSLLAAITHTSTWSPHLAQDFRAQYSRFRWNYGRPAAGQENSLRAVVYDTSGTLLAVTGSPGYVFDEIENTLQLASTVHADRNDGRLKFGFDGLRSDHSLLGGGNVNGNYTVAIDAAARQRLAGLGRPITVADIPANAVVTDYQVEARRTTFGRAQDLLGLFAEDELRLGSRLTAQVGVRWDYDDLTRSGGHAADLNNLAPRLSLNWQPNDRSALKAGYGIFYEKLPYAIFSDAMQFSSRSPAFLSQLAKLFPGRDPSDFTFDGNITADFSGANAPAFGQGRSADAVRANVDALPARELRILNPDGWQLPYSHQVSLGYERELSEVWTMSADAVGIWGRDLVRLRDLNAPAAWVPTYDSNGNLIPRSPATADSTRPLGTPNGGARTLTISETSGRSRYVSLHLQLKRRFRAGLGVNVAYTLSRSENDTDDINFRASDANRYGREWGPSANDRRHVLGLNVITVLPRGVSLSMNGLVQSGQPIDRVAPITAATQYGDLNGDGPQFGDSYTANLDRLPGVPRNGERLPWSSQFDLGLAKSVRLANGAVTLRADVFNLFNSVNQSGFANGLVALASNRLQTGAPGDPIVYRNAGPARQMQFTATWGF